MSVGFRRQDLQNVASTLQELVPLMAVALRTKMFLISCSFFFRKFVCRRLSLSAGALPTGNHGSALNGAITLPNAKTETNKMGTDPIGNLCLCLSVLYERHFNGLGVGQCAHTINTNW